MTSRSKYDDQQVVDALKNALMDLPDEWVACRDMRHAWSVMNDYHVTNTTARGRNMVYDIVRDLQCSRCETVRHEVYVYNGNGLEKQHQHYQYPDRYQFHGIGIPRGVKPSSLVQNEQYRRAMERIVELQKAMSVTA